MKKLLAILLLASAPVPAFAGEFRCPAPAAPPPVAEAPDSAMPDAIVPEATSATAEANEDVLLYTVLPDEPAPKPKTPDSAMPAAGAPENTLPSTNARQTMLATLLAQAAASQNDRPDGIAVFTGTKPERTEARQTGETARETKVMGPPAPPPVTAKVWTSTPDGIVESYLNPAARAEFLKQEALREMAMNEVNGTANTEARDAYCQFISPAPTAN